MISLHEAIVNPIVRGLFKREVKGYKGLINKNNREQAKKDIKFLARTAKEKDAKIQRRIKKKY